MDTGLYRLPCLYLTPNRDGGTLVLSTLTNTNRDYYNKNEDGSTFKTWPSNSLVDPFCNVGDIRAAITAVYVWPSPWKGATLSGALPTDYLPITTDRP